MDKTKPKSNTKYGGFFIHHKHNRLIVKKQLKKQYPNWKRLTEKEKRSIAKKMIAKIIKLYEVI